MACDKPVSYTHLHPLPLFILFCRTEMAVKELFQWGELFKFPVRPLQRCV